jgi:4-amino-4-deoxy-L-arabinose transferase-like glycosyltransferase
MSTVADAEPIQTDDGRRPEPPPVLPPSADWESVVQQVSPVALTAGEPDDAAFGPAGENGRPLLHRLSWGLLALLLIGGFFFCIWTFHTTADPGTDQNGYLVGGKQLARTLSTALRPVRPGTEDGTSGEGGAGGQFDPHQFIGNMWVGAAEGTPQEHFYPKYPLGYPLMVATVLWVTMLLGGGHDLATIAAYWINPLAMMLSVIATYRLARRFMDGFGSLLATFVYAISPMTFLLSESNNSHATAVLCASWGMERLFAFWARARDPNRADHWTTWASAVAAGLLLGYAATIRYSEGTLFMPALSVAVLSLRPRVRKSWVQSAALMASWALPIILLVIYNLAAIGTLTGYDSTNESTGFAWSNAADNWETMLRHLNTYGLSMMFPFALAGLVLLLQRRRQAGIVMCAWIIPCLLTYTFYYWAPDNNSVNYARFFQTILPGLSICAVWFLMQITSWDSLRDLPLSSARRNALKTTGALFLGLLAVGVAAIKLFDAAHDPTSPPVYLPAVWPGAAAVGIAVALIALAVVGSRARAWAILAALLICVSVAMQAQNAAAMLETALPNRLNLLASVAEVQAAVPQGATVFCGDVNLLNNLQFADDYALYQGETFNRGYVNGLLNDPAPNQPLTLDYTRRLSLYHRLSALNDTQLANQAGQIIDASLAAGRRVFVVVAHPLRVQAPPRGLLAPLGRLLGAARQGGNARGGGGGAGGGSGRLSVIPEALRRQIAMGKYETHVVAFWSEPQPPPQRASWMRGARFGQAPNGPPDPRTWEIIEVTRRP